MSWRTSPYYYLVNIAAIVEGLFVLTTRVLVDIARDPFRREKLL